MSSLWNNNALKEALQQVVNNSPPSPANLTLRLFTNNFSPAVTDLIAAYTECADGSYAGIPLTGSSWTITTGSGGASATYAGVMFSFAGANSLYGWYMTDAANTKVYAAGNFVSPPISVPSGGGTLTVTPTLPAISP